MNWVFRHREDFPRKGENVRHGRLEVGPEQNCPCETKGAYAWGRVGR